jgi:hypothetical protein
MQIQLKIATGFGDTKTPVTAYFMSHFRPKRLASASVLKSTLQPDVLALQSLAT